MIVASATELSDLCRRLRQAGSFGLDTEFVRERTFFIQLGTIQVAAKDVEAIIDPLALADLAPFLDLLSDPEVEKIVHAGEQDLAIFYERTGTPPRRVYDTQIAAALVGLGDQISYAKLVERVTGVRLSKLETLTDWMARPLTPAQIDYALDDVRYLDRIRAHLNARLLELGRESWVREELAHLEEADTYAVPKPHEVYRRLKTGSLDAERLGVLREVAAWREEEAMRRNLPRGWVMKDPALLAIARRKPQTIQSLRQIRSLKNHELERHGTALLAAVRRGLAEPVTEPPAASIQIPSRLEPLVKLLEAWLQARALSAEIATSMLATRDQLKAIAMARNASKPPSVPVLSGWRRDVVGQELLDIAAGRLSLGTRSGELVTRRSGEKPK